MARSDYDSGGERKWSWPRDTWLQKRLHQIKSGERGGKERQDSEPRDKASKQESKGGDRSEKE